MVLDYLGLEISQTKIAYELRGWREVLVKWISYEWTKGATLDELYNGLDGWEFNGIKIRTVGARPYDNNYKKFAKFYLFPQLYASLKEGKPVIIGYKEQGVTNGHAVVAYGIKYEISNGEITPKIIYIADPASGIKKWTPQDINNKDILGFFTIYY
jgi:hypothetical protein